MQTSWLLVAAAMLAASGSSVSAMNAVFAASTSQCSSVETCYEGGASSTPCTVSSGGCPPCITFADDGCYVKVSGSCPFGVDCSSVWGSSSTTSSASSTTSTTSTTTNSSSKTSGTSTSTSSTTSDSTGTAGTTSSKSDTNSTGTAGTTTNSTTSSRSGSSGTAAGDTTSSGSDMSVVFAIIGAAIGVIAVAVIFLTLVRRSKAAREDDDDDMANTPPAFAKNPVVQAPHSTTGATTYASYNRPAGVGSGTAGEIGLDMSKNGGVSMNAVSYYNQQPPMNSAAPSPRVAGRAIPSQPVGTVGMGRPFGSNPNFAASGGVGVTSGLGASGVGVTSQAPPAPMQHIPMGGVAPSPHTRRESYEF
ncbi:Carbohydrate-binding protein [Phytophthora cinnamomi]|uniref:Carbohydrate-binding protein n=1 Tax=Phytophthora cinnamomi TaxID=4785 RepID=UPI00355AA734|nr:Carbohydrate-binding protein [Phytophthora cinnamomi]